ncbi:MAG: hypothetical protein CMM01_22380 [Rhodopirellula sp.]|nr:hypothetical protein [Rhodopirellula sp.]OUX49379.1 MAG: hypothetical protein CBE43_10115 [Rhodopirellula sp. TMED283]
MASATKEKPIPNNCTQQINRQPVKPHRETEFLQQKVINIGVAVLAALNCKFTIFQHPDLRKLADAEKNEFMFEISKAGVTRNLKRRKPCICHKPRRLN